ncbi:SPL family radical SAM protein [Leptolyngbya iicbica]|uniref:Radical SAM protein n=2 Tax=Cyanophyceae TaxID=3028117 RepID=A0A4V2E3E3_9CYAN|nr:radical SAM protein [Leptolyngbya sp. LK]RZM82140.1 radical SAM protein [Leptolyngbya sp. LK]
MANITGREEIVNPLQKSSLNKKGLCDYVINVASGCLHGCTFCYVPSTPAIRTKQMQLKSKGVNDPQIEWGKYLFIRDEIPKKLDNILSRKKKWVSTLAGKGVVLLCSGTDPYQNQTTAKITREVIQILLKYDKRVRILTRSPLWLKDLDLLVHPNVTVGMSIPAINDELMKRIEPFAPPTSLRYQALLEGAAAGCRLYAAIAPTPPQMGFEDFLTHLGLLMQIKPEVLFWEPINARGTNGKRMLLAGLEFANSIMNKTSWAENFLRQWEQIEHASQVLGCMDLLHIWADRELEGVVDKDILNYWWYKPTVENWETEVFQYSDESRPILKRSS